MKRSGESILKKLFKTAASANAFHLFGPKSWSPQTDYMPVQSGKEEISKADMHHKTVTAREKEVRNSLLMPLITIIGVVLVLVVTLLVSVRT